MKKLALVFVMLAAAPLLLTGCGETYPDEEMHLGNVTKTRPLSITVTPPDAAPGDTVSVSLLYYSKRADDVDAIWQVALDFSTGQYEEAYVERNIVNITGVPEPSVDDKGFVTQEFDYIIPDSTLLWTSAIGEVITDDQLAPLIGELVGSSSGPVTKVMVDEFLASLTPEVVATLDSDEQQAVFALADLFACKVRFRARLQGETTVDVTRSLTVRHSRRLGSPNANTNCDIARFAVAAIDQEDVDGDDLASLGDKVNWYYFINDGLAVSPVVQVPRHANWTYYATVEYHPQVYNSPFDLDFELSEQADYRWYYFRLDNPTSAHQLFVDEEGDEAEMWNLDENARMAPPANNGARFQLIACVRDERPEWDNYHGAPGATTIVGEVEFVDPQILE